MIFNHSLFSCILRQFHCTLQNACAPSLFLSLLSVMSEISSPGYKVDENFRLVLVEGGRTQSISRLKPSDLSKNLKPYKLTGKHSREETAPSGNWNDSSLEQEVPSIPANLCLLCRPFFVSCEMTFAGVLSSVATAVDQELYANHCELLTVCQSL